MARFDNPAPDNGNLVFDVDPATGCTTVEFAPTARARRLATKSAQPLEPVRLLTIEPNADVVAIYPINTHPGSAGFLGPKYDRLRLLSLHLPVSDPVTDVDELQMLLEGLPRGFTRDPQYGLGFPREYQCLVDVIEKHTKCTKLVFSDQQPIGVHGSAFYLSLAEFTALRAELDRIRTRAQTAASRVKTAHTHNVLAEALGLTPVEIRRGTHPVTQLLTDRASRAKTLDDAEQDELVAVAVAESRRLAQTRPDVLAKLRSDIDMVNLDGLITRFEAALTEHRLEDFWQRFFRENPFALHLVFGYPIIKMQEQASVGGLRFSGNGNKITDFLVKHAITSNVGIFEIKKPGSPVVRTKSYREGVYGPSAELTDALTQVLDQKYQLESSMALLKHSSGIVDLQSYSIQCCLIIGRTPESIEQRKSLELFRNNLSTVDVITYDELLEKMKVLRGFLAGAEPAS